MPALAQLTRHERPALRAGPPARRAARTRSILPWTNDKVADANFPAAGPVYQEAAKALPGLAGESRSGDANGQWFRVLAAGGTNLVTLAPGLFATTALPIIGANPPKPAERPPLNRDVPCETQEAPDLRSQAGRAAASSTRSTRRRALPGRATRSSRKAARQVADASSSRSRTSTKSSKIADKDATKALIATVEAARGARR